MSDALTDEDLDAMLKESMRAGVPRRWGDDMTRCVAEVRRLRALLTAPPDDEELREAQSRVLEGNAWEQQRDAIRAFVAARARKIGDTDE